MIFSGLKGAIQVLIVGFCSIQALSLVAQTDAKKWNLAYEFYSLKKYPEAAAIYEQYWTISKWKGRDLYAAAESFRHANKLNLAIGAYKQLLDLGKDDQKILFSYAQTLHQNNQFLSAANAYKQYLKKLKSSDSKRSLIEQDILRCLAGNKYKHQAANSIVEPLGNTVNSALDEFGAVPSIHFPGKYYFSAYRPRADLSLDVDLYSVEETNGIWSEIQSLGSPFESEKSEYLLDFIREGKGIVFRRDSPKEKPEVWLKLFDTSHIEPAIEMDLPFKFQEKDRDGCFFQDSLFLFSSQRPGGFGGYDLYLSVNRNGIWLNPVNLGIGVNTPFDEVSPYLSKDGLTVYYSSNSLESLGGFDIFKSRFKPESFGWSAKENLGLPVNTAGNETQFRLHRNGLSAVFTSDRWDLSKGGQDIFIAYFKDELEEQFYDEAGSPLTMLYHESSGVDAIHDEYKVTVEHLEDPKPFTLDFISCREDDFVESSKCQSTLNALVVFMSRYPKVRLELIGHSNQSTNPMINLFTSVKKSSEFSSALISKGIETSRIRTVGCGSEFLICKPGLNGMDNNQSSALNNRIELHLILTSEDKIAVRYNTPKIPETLQISVPYQFQNLSQDMMYSILLGESSQMLNKEIPWQDEPKNYVEYSNGKYDYYVGQFKEFIQAKNYLLKHNLSDKTIIHAFYFGVKLEQNSIINYVQEHPDLILLLDYNKKWN